MYWSKSIISFGICYYLVTAMHSMLIMLCHFHLLIFLRGVTRSFVVKRNPVRCNIKHWNTVIIVVKRGYGCLNMKEVEISSQNQWEMREEVQYFPFTFSYISACVANFETQRIETCSMRGRWAFTHGKPTVIPWRVEVPSQPLKSKRDGLKGCLSLEALFWLGTFKIWNGLQWSNQAQSPSYFYL